VDYFVKGIASLPKEECFKFVAKDLFVGVKIAEIFY
jgi:hypothetical protein